MKIKLGKQQQNTLIRNLLDQLERNDFVITGMNHQIESLHERIEQLSQDENVRVDNVINDYERKLIKEENKTITAREMQVNAEAIAKDFQDLLRESTRDAEKREQELMEVAVKLLTNGDNTSWTQLKSIYQRDTDLGQKTGLGAAPNAVGVIKYIRDETGLGLRHSKQLFDFMRDTLAIPHYQTDLEANDS